MNERARRPILHLKSGAAPPVLAAASVPPPVTYVWKCKPCGTTVAPPAEGPDDEAVRCPACNARLGKAGDFRADPPPLDRLRARAVKAPPPPPPPKPPRPAGPVVTVRVLKKVR
jgi:DNA-directed RNA polymerase subunit RPC12/RpoP